MASSASVRRGGRGMPPILPLLSCGCRTRSCCGRPSGRRAGPRPPHPLGAGRAADRGVAVLEQRVDQDAVLVDVGVDVVLRPGRERVDLDLAALGVPLDDRGVRPGLGARRGGCPRPRRRTRPAPGQRLDLAQRAARSGSRSCSLGAVLGVLLRDGRGGGDVDDVTADAGPGRGCRWSRRSGSRCRGRPRRRRGRRGWRGRDHPVGHGRRDANRRRRCRRPSAGPVSACSTGSSMPVNQASAASASQVWRRVDGCRHPGCTPVPIRRTAKARRQALQRQPSSCEDARSSSPQYGQ